MSDKKILGMSVFESDGNGGTKLRTSWALVLTVLVNVAVAGALYGEINSKVTRNEEDIATVVVNDADQNRQIQQLRGRADSTDEKLDEISNQVRSLPERMARMEAILERIDARLDRNSD